MASGAFDTDRAGVTDVYVPPDTQTMQIHVPFVDPETTSGGYSEVGLAAPQEEQRIRRLLDAGMARNLHAANASALPISTIE